MTTQHSLFVETWPEAADLVDDGDGDAAQVATEATVLDTVRRVSVAESGTDSLLLRLGAERGDREESVRPESELLLRALEAPAIPDSRMQ